MKRSVRELAAGEIDLILAYFLQADPAFLRGMGVDPGKLPSPEEWRQLLLDDLERPTENRRFYYLIWAIDDVPVGHSNITNIIFGIEATMHLHLWRPEDRESGQGTHFVRESISRYFTRFALENLVCEPYALNPAPNKTLPKVGFELVRTYETTPGWINFHQPVNLWVLARQAWIRAAQFTVDGLITVLRAEHGKLERLLAAVGVHRMAVAGVSGVYSTKDILAHLGAYERALVTWLEEAGAGRVYVDDVLDQPDLDARNAAVHEMNKDRSAADVLETFRHGRSQLEACVARLTDRELSDADTTAWFVEPRWHRTQALWQCIANDSYEHQWEHIPDIERWLAEHSVSPKRLDAEATG